MKSVGEYPTPETSVISVNSVGGLAEGGVGMAGCHTLLNEKRSPKSFDSEDLK